jgi:hypothetical protein
MAFCAGRAFTATVCNENLARRLSGRWFKQWHAIYCIFGLAKSPALLSFSADFPHEIGCFRLDEAPNASPVRLVLNTD